MRQVPRQAGKTVEHLLIGSGRVAKHFARYLTLANISHEQWQFPRRLTDEGELSGLVSRSRRVWLLVSDDAIAGVAERVREIDPEVVLLHASGAAVIPGVRGAHPLMTFGPTLYDLPTYRRIPFIVEDLADGTPETEVLGSLENPIVPLDPAKRGIYHALVSVSGNFPAMLWADTFERFERDLGLSRDLLVPFLFRTLLNVIERGENALTGPLIRGDHTTLRRHHEALRGTPLEPLYSAFETFFASDVKAPGEFL